MDTAQISTAVIIIVVSFVLLLLGVVVTYFWIIKRYLALVQEQTQAKLDKMKESQQIIEQAHTEANKLIDQGSRKAQEIIGQAQMFQTNQSNAIAQALQKASQDYLTEYQKLLKMSGEEVNKMIQNVSPDIKSQLAHEMDSLRDVFSKQLTESQKELKEQVLGLYKTAEEEVRNYKVERMAQVEKTILEIIEEVTMNVVGKQITSDEHEKLVMKALEEAKRQKVF